MTALKQGLSWLFTAIFGALLWIQWQWGLEPDTAAGWALAILVSGEAVFVSGDARTRLGVGAFVTAALTGLLTDTPGLMTPTGRAVVYLIAIVVVIHILMILSGYRRRHA